MGLLQPCMCIVLGSNGEKDFVPRIESVRYVYVANLIYSIFSKESTRCELMFHPTCSFLFLLLRSCAPSVFAVGPGCFPIPLLSLAISNNICLVYTIILLRVF